VSPRRQPVVIYECPECEGKNKKCVYCNGTNEIKLYRCPRAIITPDIIRLVSYFVDYINLLPQKTYPNGKTRYYQPVKLLKAFKLWTKLYYEIKARAEPDEQ
jgi:hypothetical protein